MDEVIKLLNVSEYIEMSEDIAKEILSLPVCQRYKLLQKKINCESEIIDLIAEFDQAKAVYEKVERYGAKYHPDYKAVSSRLIKAKTNLFQHPDIKAIKLCENEVQEILNDITFYMRDVIKFKQEDKKSVKCKGKCSR